MEKYQLINYSSVEELFNRLTHGLGAVFSLAGLLLLVHQTALLREPWRLASCTLYGITLVLFYSISTVYHSVRPPRLRNLFRILDHCSIFLVIGGTYTPITLVVLPPAWGWPIFLVIWSLALLGTFLKIASVGRLRLLGPLFYLAMGWLVVVAWKPLTAAMPPAGIVWLVAGGLAYSLGLVFYAWEKLPFNHAVWHVFVLAGSVCHYLAVLWYVVPV